MELKISESFEDMMNFAIHTRKLSGLLSIDNKRRRHLGLFFTIFSLLILFFSVRHKTTALFILSIIYIVWGLIYIVFAEKINIRILKRNMKRNFNVISKNYNYDFKDTVEHIYKIESGYIETTNFDSIIKYTLADYCRYMEEETFYVLEFTKGKYIYLKKEAFENKDKFQEFINFIENEKGNILSSSQAR